MESEVRPGRSLEEVLKSVTITTPQQEASQEIDSIFPEGLRSRVLAFVQFETTPRMDDLVNQVYDHFREHYNVGDRVALDTEGGRRYGVIKNMTDTSRLHSMFNGQLNEDFRSYTYIMQMDDGEELTRYKASELMRDRRVYSKIILKQFLRGAVSREPWHGAPWMVKDHLAKRYNIPTKLPDAKTREAVIAAKKAANAERAAIAQRLDDASSPTNYPNAGHPQMNGIRPHDYGHINMGTHAATHPHHVNGQLVGHPVAGPPPLMYSGPPPMQYSGPLPIHYSGPSLSQFNGPQHLQNSHLPPHLATQARSNLPAHLTQHVPPQGNGLPIGLPFQNNFMQYQTLANQPLNVPPYHSAPVAKPFEPIKYPIDDLRIRQPRVTVTRPPLKFLSDDVPDGVDPPEDHKKTGILMKSIGPLLTIWETLNVHDTIYSLDSFTIDDFIEAMGYASEDPECELLVEVHCAVLKQYVNESGKLQVQLPSMIDEEESEDEEESSKEATPEPEPPKRTTRSSLRRSEIAEIVEKPRTPTPEPLKEVHKAAEFVTDFNWVEMCKERNFREGGWQAILVGLLHQLSYNPSHKEDCDEILSKLVSPDTEPSVENIATNYLNLDVNLRIAALDMALRPTVTTEQFRDQLQNAAQDMTSLRKEKIEYQRKRKELYVYHKLPVINHDSSVLRADEMFKLDIERKIALPLNTPASPTDGKATPDVSMAGITDVKEDEEDSDSSVEAKNNARKVRKAVKVTKRKRDSEVAKKEKAKKAKAEAAKTKQQKDWEKLLDDIEKKKEELRECEANIAELDDDLREASVHRSKILGKDRFLNKYYWFEHNGMPFGGVPQSSTAEYGYANGRVWVQGPDELEIQPNLEEPALSQDMAEFGWTVPIRKEREEGPTHLKSSADWGYYDDPEDIEKLMAWLDERGTREKALRKELLLFRDRIAEYMQKMKAHLEASGEEEEREEDEDEEDEEDEEEVPTTRSTRNKASAAAEKTAEEEQPRCLLWTNSMMREREGYNHSEEYEPPKRAKKGTAKVTKSKGRK
ncbi:glycosyl transferase [Paraconiothyrium brasiliense]|uniref:Glycosyl transferase n=1 Tax=Paraconiothyrium brasiliense TaxID=300254 RepID=A0ABR3RQA5_9PLEO